MRHFIFALCIGILCTAPLQASAEQPNPEEIKKSIRLLQEGGLIMKLDARANAVFVDPYLWSNVKFDSKQTTAWVMAQWCSIEDNNSTPWVEIKDGYSGKKLAKYDAWGFKTF